MAQGDQFVTQTSRAFPLCGSSGPLAEPINPEAWLSYHEIPGGRPLSDRRYLVADGNGRLSSITPLPGATALKPGSATKPFFGVSSRYSWTKKAKRSKGPAKESLPARLLAGQMRTVYRDHERFFNTYFSQFPGLYFTGDGCRRDEDGYYWITGRIDDVLNVSGHRLGTAEVESAWVAHHAVSEAAVVGFPHPLEGQGIYAYVTLKVGVSPSDSLKEELKECVKQHIGGLARPDAIQWAPALPKTRSGKIMRRILRKIASNDVASLGYITALADPEAVKQLVANRAQIENWRLDIRLLKWEAV